MDGDNTNVWISANLCKNVSARAFRMNVENHDTKTKLMQRITVYTKPACPQCRATPRALERAGLDYEAVDISADTQARDFVMSFGHLQAPS